MLNGKKCDDNINFKKLPPPKNESLEVIFVRYKYNKKKVQKHAMKTTTSVTDGEPLFQFIVQTIVQA